MGLTLAAPARLLIHAEDAAGPGAGPLISTLKRLHSLCNMTRRRDDEAKLQVQIEDLQGKTMLSIASAGALTDVPLPVGTYRVTARRGKLRRAYTMRIELGAPFELYLHLTPARR